MNRDIVLAEWRRARESLRAAELLTRENCYADAVSRTYYAVLHAAKAALQVHDIAAESHAAVGRMFGLHLVRPGDIEREWAKHLGKGLDERLAADYDPQVSFSKEKARRECSQTRQFVRRIRRYLLDSGFKESELRKRTNDG
jgi:uncharacterized protein (UPF0332 family)